MKKFVVAYQNLVDSNDVTHKFVMYESNGGFSFTLDEKSLDRSYSPHGYKNAMAFFRDVCDDVEHLDSMVQFLNVE